MINELILTGLIQGLILSLVAYGVMIPFRILNFPDLTAEGAYPLAGAVCASLLTIEINPYLAIILAAITSGIVGIGTALVHLKLRVNTLLSGIIISTMLYSVSLRVMGKPNIALFNNQLVFSDSNLITPKVIVILLIIGLAIIPFYLFLKTELGLRLKAIGLNLDFAKRQNISITKYTILGLFIANFYTGLAGGLMVQLQHYMDIGMGIGIVIHALAALMIGESILDEKHKLLAPLIGAIIYQQIQGIALFAGFAPTDLKFLTGIIVLVVLSINKHNRAKI